MTCFHVELETHDVVLAEGLAVESYLENGSYHDFEGGAALSLHHWLADVEVAPCVKKPLRRIPQYRVNQRFIVPIGVLTPRWFTS